ITNNDPRVRIARGFLFADDLTAELGQPGTTPEAPIPDAERKAAALRAIEALRKASLNPGYDVLPAEAAIRAALRDPDLAPVAIEIAAVLPVKEAQQDLAGVVMSAVKPELRVQAAAALARHIQRFGPVLTATVVQRLTDLVAAADTPPELKT